MMFGLEFIDQVIDREFISHFMRQVHGGLGKPFYEALVMKTSYHR
jgi:hypothetical protein